MAPKKMSPSEYRAQKEEETKTAAGDVPRGVDAEMADAENDQDDDLACDVVGSTNDVPMTTASPEIGEVVGAPSSPNPMRGLDGGTGVVITNGTDDDEYVDGMRPRIVNAPERYPWRISVHLYRQWEGNRSATATIPLFDCSSFFSCKRPHAVLD